MNDFEYLQGMARQTRDAIGHTKEGREHAERLEAMAAKLEQHSKSGGDSDREFELRLLAAAHCPNCDNTGTTPEGDECEWCFHRKRAIAHLKSPPKPNSSGGA